jgi:hypothetical protein
MAYFDLVKEVLDLKFVRESKKSDNIVWRYLESLCWQK